jgi:hypothetical protein
MKRCKPKTTSPQHLLYFSPHNILSRKTLTEPQQKPFTGTNFTQTDKIFPFLVLLLALKAFTFLCDEGEPMNDVVVPISYSVNTTTREEVDPLIDWLVDGLLLVTRIPSLGPFQPQKKSQNFLVHFSCQNF